MRKKIELYEDNVGFVEYVSHMGSDVTVVNSARVSFGKHITDLDESEISRRYTDFNLEFYEPKQFRKQSESNRQASVDEWFDPEYGITDHPLCASDLLKQHHDASLYVYNKLLELGVCREQARGALPQNLYTEYYGTCNLNNLFKFIGLRMHKGAQWEIQQVAEATLNIAENLFPVTTQAYINILKEKNNE